MVNLEEIKSFFKGKISIGEPLSDHTSYRIGGPADYYFEPVDKSDLVNLVGYFEKLNFPHIILGNGTNLLVSDEGVRAAVISLENSLNDRNLKNNIVYAGAGIKLSKFVDFCIQNGKMGSEMLAGIPGSLGGALVMNASAFNGSISDHLYDVEVYSKGQIFRLKKDEIKFAYRTSSLNDKVILEAGFDFPDGDKERIASIRKELLDYRKSAQPVSWPSAGCVFKNPPGYHAAVIIQEANLKGVRIGGAEVSDLHGNFIINTGKATAKDVIELINVVRKRVQEKLNLTLELEVKMLGFTHDPFNEK
jgi:UDP-N-acetylmuramate dehydrogenase